MLESSALRFHVHNSDKTHIELIELRIAVRTVLIFCGLEHCKWGEGDKWHMTDFNDLQVFKMTNLKYDATADHYCKDINLMKPILVEEFGINLDKFSKMYVDIMY